MTLLINFLLYQVGWFACVLGLSWDVPWLGFSIALCLVGVHVWLAKDRVLQIKLAFAAGGLGLLVDSVQLWAGVFAFPRGSVVPWLPPPCITLLWMQFATTFRYSMRWLSGHYALGAGLGLVGAPLAFFVGERLGAVEFLPPRRMHFAVLGLLWSGSIPLLVYISDRLAGRIGVPPNYRWPGPRRGESRPQQSEESKT